MNSIKKQIMMSTVTWGSVYLVVSENARDSIRHGLGFSLNRPSLNSSITKTLNETYKDENKEL